MNIEIANRMYEMRKQNSLSQEELAEKLGVSRQAVSKWERAESSPDTDNLIALARLYGVSLDELLFTTEPVESKEEQQPPEPCDQVHIGFDGIHVTDRDGSEVHVGFGGIQVKDKGNLEFDSAQSWDEIKENMKGKWAIRLPVALIVTAAYLLMGFVWNLWHPGWLVFLAIPVLYELAAMVAEKDLHKQLNLFPVAPLVVAAYLSMGFFWSLWHPGWAVFLLIPLYYSLVAAMFKK